MRRIMTVLALMAGLCVACTTGADHGSLVGEIAVAFDAEFVHAREAVVKIDAFVEDLLANQGRYDLDIAKMDVAQGGRYRVFKQVMYVTDHDDGGGSYIATGSAPVTDATRRRAKLMEYAVPLLRELAREDHSNLVMSRDGLGGVVYPYTDLSSTIPPGLDYTTFPWYYFADAKHNPSRGTVWMPAPYVLLHDGNWVVDVIAPAYVGDRLEAVVAHPVYLARIGRRLIGNRDEALLFLTRDGAVISASRGARERFGIREVEPASYVVQARTNRYLERHFRLADESYPEAIRELGTRLRGQQDLEILFNGERCAVHARPLAEHTNFLVVGLWPR